MTNLANILKHCPKGTKLYSPICGDCMLRDVDSDGTYPINVVPCSDTYPLITFTNEGKLSARFNGECLLFPSENQRDWEAFQAPVKRGDIMMLTDKTAVFMVDTMKDNHITTIAYTNKHSDFRVGQRIFLSYIPASKDMKEKLFKAMDKAGYVWDGETLKKKEYQFKPFEKVLVRNGELAKWRCSFYSHFDQEGVYHHTTISGIYSMCIPFKGNEHLVGTADNP